MIMFVLGHGPQFFLCIVGIHFIYIHKTTTLLQNHHTDTTLVMQPDYYFLFDKENQWEFPTSQSLSFIIFDLFIYLLLNNFIKENHSNTC